MKLRELKDALISGTGFFGSIFFRVLLYALTFAPVLFCRFPWWLDLVVLGIIFFTGTIGGIATVLVWIYSFIVVVSHPIGWLEIIYFVLFGLYLFFFFIPTTVKLIQSRKR